MISSSARVTSVNFQKDLGWSEIETAGPIDRTPGTLGPVKAKTMTNTFKEQKRRRRMVVRRRVMMMVQMCTELGLTANAIIIQREN